MKAPIPFLFVILFVLAACKKENHGIGTLEDGIWVEATHRKDTIIFKSFDDTESTWLILNRGREMRGGHSLPKMGAGIYDYRLGSGEISLYSLLSSSLIYHDYPFQYNGAKIRIGDFYEGTGGLKTFIQVRN